MDTLATELSVDLTSAPSAAYPVVETSAPRSHARVDARSDVLNLLYRGHHGWLFGWLRKKMGCAHSAADLAQDTFTKLLALPELPPLREPRAYLLVTANHLLINQHHRRKVEADTLRTLAILAEDRLEQSPEESAAVRQLLSRVLLLLANELEEKPRRAFLMARVDGLSYAEIAKELGVSESSVKQYLTKVLAHCHARLFDMSGARDV